MTEPEWKTWSRIAWNAASVFSRQSATAAASRSVTRESRSRLCHSDTSGSAIDAKRHSVACDADSDVVPLGNALREKEKLADFANTEAL